MRLRSRTLLNYLCLNYLSLNYRQRSPLGTAHVASGDRRASVRTRGARGHVSAASQWGAALLRGAPVEEVPPVPVPSAPPSGSASRDVLRARPPPLPGERGRVWGGLCGG